MIQKNSRNNRGQTIPDYAIAFGVFMLAVLLAFAATSQLFEPYQSEQERIGEANRVANHLVHTSLLSDETQQYVLDKDCTVSAFQAFKGNSPTLYDKCYYEDNIDDVSYRNYIGLKNDRAISVAIVDDSNSIITQNGVQMTFGSNVPDVANTTNAYRMVKLDGQQYRVRVTTW